MAEPRAAALRDIDQDRLLDRLLDRLEQEVIVGARQRAEALMLIARFSAHGLPPRTPQDFARILSPLLATSPESQKRVAEICAEVLTPTPAGPDVRPPVALSRWLRATRWLRQRPWVIYAAIAALLLPAAVLVGSQVEHTKKPPVSSSQGVAGPVPPSPEVLGPDRPTEAPAAAIVRRTLTAADADGTATPRRLSLKLSVTTSAREGVDGYLLRLVDYTGFAPDQLLPMWDANVVTRLANAVARIELAGATPVLDDIQRQASDQVKALADRPEVLKRSARECGSESSPRCIEMRDKLPALDEFAKGTPFTKPWPWEREMPQPPAATYAPAGADWVAAALPLMLAIVWFGWRMVGQRERWLEELRREVPANHPLRHPGLAKNAHRLAKPDEGLRRSARALARRLPVPSRVIDVRRTIGRIARTGNPFDVVLGENRPPAEYLLLIETSSGPDHQARGFQRLADRLRAMDLSVETFHYVTSPRRCFRAWQGEAVPLESLARDYPDHRLVILGQGRGLLDPVDLEPEPWARLLDTWQRRALLTPLPAQSWGVEEMTMAVELGIALGRATPEGLRELPALLGLEGRDRSPVEVIREQQSKAGMVRRASRLPALLGTPQRWLNNRPPRADAWGELRPELLIALGRDGYAWLAACALYPAIDWDLTLYLGWSLRGASGQPVYNERALAVLSALPWFRSNRMPDWLRSELVKDLPERQKEQALKALGELLNAPPLDERDRRHWAAAPTLPPAAARPYRDKLFVTALVESQARANGTPHQLDKLKNLVPFRWGWRETVVAIVALLYAVAAWMVTPNAADGALGPGAWLPVILLMVLGAAALWIAAPAVRAIDFDTALRDLAARVQAMRRKPAPEPPAPIAEGENLSVLICVAPEDATWVVPLVRALRIEAGLRASTTIEFNSSPESRTRLDAAIKDAAFGIVIWSRQSVDSSFVRTVARDIGQLGKPMLPIVVDDTRPPLTFADLTTIYMPQWTGPELPEELRSQIQAARLAARTKQEPTVVPLDPASSDGPDIFVSYSRQDREWTTQLVQAFTQRGWSVFWDMELEPGTVRSDALDKSMRAARVVVVVWSTSSMQSSWVLNEARHAMERGVIIPVLKDPIPPPSEFGCVQAADLSSWSGGDLPDTLQRAIERRLRPTT